MGAKAGFNQRNGLMVNRNNASMKDRKRSWLELLLIRLMEDLCSTRPKPRTCLSILGSPTAFHLIFPLSGGRSPCNLGSTIVKPKIDDYGIHVCTGHNRFPLPISDLRRAFSGATIQFIHEPVKSVSGWNFCGITVCLSEG